ncbi:fumarylacetoacetate hydrolase family protein [Niallia sp. 03133]|uniref:fumarylacetoacetate hydrolase family protein n=1 Tax=Niallia sp. 03133 TaxID=3458060 RepID=UPI004045098D
MATIKNIYCIGRNYVLHALELKNEIPTSPMVFSKPTHSIAYAKGETINLPANRGIIHFETELVIHIGKDYYKGAKADDLIDKMALGIDFTLRDVQTTLKEKRHPWLAAKGFPQSAVLTDFIPFPGVEAAKEKNFSLEINGKVAQVGNISDIIFDFQTIIDFCASNFGIGEGDIIFTGTPSGVGEVIDGDKFSLKWGDEILGTCQIVI